MSLTTTERILRLREGAAVERCHTTPHLNSYSVGAHSFGMLLLFEVLYPEPLPAHMYRAVMLHDLAERWTGDLPGYIGTLWPPFKEEMNEATAEIERKMGAVAHHGLTPEEKLWLKAIDRFELILFCFDQLAYGNHHVDYMFEWTLRWFRENSEIIPAPVWKAFNSFHWYRTQDEGPKT